MRRPAHAMQVKRADLSPTNFEAGDHRGYTQQVVVHWHGISRVTRETCRVAAIRVYEHILRMRHVAVSPFWQRMDNRRAPFQRSSATLAMSVPYRIDMVAYR